MLLRSFDPMSRLLNVITYTGHGALIMALLVVGGTTLGITATEFINPVLVEPVIHKGDYISLLIKTVPALSILGGVVYMFIRYLERRDGDLRNLLERTITALNDNSKALNDIRMDNRRKP